MSTAFIGVIDENGQCLVVQNVRQKWMMPGGVVDDNEKSEDAAIRELQEEAGVIVENGPQVIPLTMSTNPCQLYQTVINSSEHDFDDAFKTRLTPLETINFGFVDLLQPGKFKVVSHEHDRFRDGTEQHLHYLRDSLKQTPPIFNNMPENCNAFKSIVDNTSNDFKSALNRTRFIACVPQENPQPKMSDPELCNVYVAQHIFLTSHFDGVDDEQFKKDMLDKDTQQSPYVCMGPDSIEFTVRENQDNCLSAVKSYIQDRRGSNGDFTSVIPELEAFYEVWKEIDSFKSKAAQMTLLAFLSAFYYTTTRGKEDVLSKKEDYYNKLAALLEGSGIPLLYTDNAFYVVLEGIPKQYGFDICAPILSVDDFIGLEKVDESWAFSELKKSESVEVVSVEEDDQRRIYFPGPPLHDKNSFSIKITDSNLVMRPNIDIAKEDCLGDPKRDAARNCVFTTKRSIYRRCKRNLKYYSKSTDPTYEPTAAEIDAVQEADDKIDEDMLNNNDTDAEDSEKTIKATPISDLDTFLLLAMSSLSVSPTRWAWSTGNSVAPL